LPRYFFQFFSYLAAREPKINAKSSTFFRRKAVLNLYSNVKAQVDRKLEQDLPKCNQIAMTSDHWTSRANEPYQSLTLHYIDEDFTLVKFLVKIKSFEGRQVTQAIILTTNSMIRELQLPLGIKIAMVTDAGSAVKKAMSESEEIDTNLICLDHIVNTCVNASLDCTATLKTLIAKVKLLMN